MSFAKKILPLLALVTTLCKPGSEKVYEASFELRAARELDAIGDELSARHYLSRALQDKNARSEAYAFLAKIKERKTEATACIEAKRTDLQINQYPRSRHKNLFQLALCTEAAGDLRKALDIYNLSENAGGKQPQLYIRRALLKEKLSDAAGAQTDFERAVSLNAEYLPGQLTNSLFLLRNGKSTGIGKALGMLRLSKPAYADILEDAERHREGFARVVHNEVTQNAGH